MLIWLQIFIVFTGLAKKGKKSRQREMTIMNSCFKNAIWTIYYNKWLETKWQVVKPAEWTLWVSWTQFSPTFTCDLCLSTTAMVCILYFKYDSFMWHSVSSMLPFVPTCFYNPSIYGEVRAQTTYLVQFGPLSLTFVHTSYGFNWSFLGDTHHEKHLYH